MDTGQVETGRIEDEMRRTRARIDGKLDELSRAVNGRMATVRRLGPWTAVAVAAMSAAAVLWMRRRRRQGLPRHVGIPRMSRLEDAYFQ